MVWVKVHGSAVQLVGTSNPACQGGVPSPGGTASSQLKTLKKFKNCLEQNVFYTDCVKTNHQTQFFENIYFAVCLIENLHLA